MRRLVLPAYRVKDAARYAGITPKTILNWQGDDSRQIAGAVAERAKGAALSYLQLVEVAFVAKLRAAGIRLSEIKDARDYMAQHLGTEFPFATQRFKTEGQDILMNLSEFVKGAAKNKLVKVNRGGQLAWGEILETKFQEFDYHGDLAIRWKVGGAGSLILIDPRVSFGAPAIKGVPTWAIKGRWECGETLEDIAEDFSINVRQVKDALEFEGVSEPPADTRCSH